MKILVAATCIAMFAAVGYFLWGEYEVSATAKKHAEAAVKEQRRVECTELLVAYKHGGAAGLSSAAEAENKARQCAEFINVLYGLSGDKLISVDDLGVYTGTLD